MSDEWIPFLVVADIVAIAWFVHYRATRNAWPEPAPRPHICSDCARLFVNPKVLALHQRAEHTEEVGPLYWKLPPRNRDLMRRSKWRSALPQLRLVRTL